MNPLEHPLRITSQDLAQAASAAIERALAARQAMTELSPAQVQAVSGAAAIINTLAVDGSALRIKLPCPLPGPKGPVLNGGLTPLPTQIASF